jgi:hypothetical protein
MPKFIEKYGMAVRDGVYEAFMEAAQVTDLNELKEAGYSVREVLTNPPSEWDKLYILIKDNTIKCGCSIYVDWKAEEPHVTFYDSLEAKEYLRKVRSNLAVSESGPAGKPNNRRMN